ncbi:MAG TPA: hypothetical protein DCX07_02580 [Phycisphaerales bacterium]|nr:hypothetical protein [Phycisphaerales bacterium]
MIELLVVVAILSLLVSILLPSLSKAKDLARTVVCLANVKGLAQNLQLYLTDYSGKYPYGMEKEAESGLPGFGTDPTSTRGRSIPYLFYSSYMNNSGESLFLCPTDPKDVEVAYGEQGNYPGEFVSTVMKRRGSYTYNSWSIWAWAKTFKKTLRDEDIARPAEWGYCADSGLRYFNGWTWDHQDPQSPYILGGGLLMIRWTHQDRVNMLFGDFHVSSEAQDGYLGDRVIMCPSHTVAP